MTLHTWTSYLQKSIMAEKKSVSSLTQCDSSTTSIHAAMSSREKDAHSPSEEINNEKYEEKVEFLLSLGLIEKKALPAVQKELKKRRREARLAAFPSFHLNESMEDKEKGLECAESATVNPSFSKHLLKKDNEENSAAKKIKCCVRK